MAFISREKVELDQHLQEGIAATESGLLVLAVGQGGPADVAGLKAGDLVTHANSEPVSTIGQLEGVIGKGRPTDPLSLTVRRQSGSVDVRIFPRVR